MASSVVFIDRRIMDFAFLISLTLKNFFPQPSSSPFLTLPLAMVCIFQAVDCPHLRRQYMFNEFFNCICIGFSEFNKPAMYKISHSHFFVLFVLPFRTEHSTYFILSKVCHFVGGLKHKSNLCLSIICHSDINRTFTFSRNSRQA